MPRAPFQIDSQQPGIAPVSLQGGYVAHPVQQPIADPSKPSPIVSSTTDNTIGMALSGFADVLKMAKGISDEKDYREASAIMQQEIKSVELALVARANPKYGQQLLAQEGLSDPVVRGAMAEMREITNAVNAGVLPQQYALQRLSVIKQNATAAAPEFADEIKALMQDATGRDPDKALFGYLLDTANPKPAELSPEEKGLMKAQEELAYQAALLGVSQAEVMELGQTRAISEQEKALNTIRIERGERVSENLRRNLEIDVGHVIQDSTHDFLLQVKQGGVLDVPSAKAAFDARLDEMIISTKQNLPAGANLDNELANIEKMRSLMHTRLESGAMTELLTTQSDVLTKAVKLGMMQTPEMLFALSASPNDFVKGLDWMLKAGDTKYGQKVAGQLHTGIKAILDTTDGRKRFFDFYNQLIAPDTVTSTKVPKTPEERDAAAVAAHLALQSKEVETQSRALNALIESHGKTFTFQTLGSKNVFNAIKDKNLGAAVENLQIAQTTALQQKFNEVVRLPNFDKSLLTYNERQGELEYRRGAGSEENLIRPILNWVAEFNQAAHISELYTGNGKISAALYPSFNKYFDLVTQEGFAGLAAQEEQRANGVPTETIIEWTSDENGIPVPMEK